MGLTAKALIPPRTTHDNRGIQLLLMPMTKTFYARKGPPLTHHLLLHTDFLLLGPPQTSTSTMVLVPLMQLPQKLASSHPTHNPIGHTNTAQTAGSQNLPNSATPTRPQWRSRHTVYTRPPSKSGSPGTRRFRLWYRERRRYSA